jgi:hypothetical protein
MPELGSAHGAWRSNANYHEVGVQQCAAKMSLAWLFSSLQSHLPGLRRERTEVIDMKQYERTDPN